MEIPYFGQNLSNAMDIVGGMANPPGGQGPAGLFEISFASAGPAAAIGTTTAPACWNPPQSGRLIRIMRVLLGDVSGTLTRANLRYYRAIPPANVISGVTDVSSTIQSRSRNVNSVAKWYSALTCTPAASIFMPVGFGSGGAIAAQFYWLQDQPEGITVVQPGELWYPFVSNGASALTADLGIIWIETPIPQGN
jgi:hypothetical protein